MGNETVSEQSEEQVNKTPDSQPVADLTEAIKARDFDRAADLINENHECYKLNETDEEGLTLLQKACHEGSYRLAESLLARGADVNFSKRDDKYTPLMFAAIRGSAQIVSLLLEHGVDTTVENCVNRTAAQMAAFVGQTKIVSLINNFVPFEASIGPFTRCRELEDRPRISSMALARLFHSFIIHPSLHPVKLLLFIRCNPDLVEHAPEFIFILENLSSKALKPPRNDETLSFKYYYLSYLIQCCRKAYEAKYPSNLNNNCNTTFDRITSERCVEAICRKLIKRDSLEDSQPCTKKLDQFILDCILKYPYTQLAIFKTMTYALAKRDNGDFSALSILTQTLNEPRSFGQRSEVCSVCGDFEFSKKCSKCKSIYYCGNICQRIDWFQHKRVCRSPEEEPLLPDENGDIETNNDND